MRLVTAAVSAARVSRAAAVPASDTEIADVQTTATIRVAAARPRLVVRSAQTEGHVTSLVRARLWFGKSLRLQDFGRWLEGLQLESHQQSGECILCI